MDILHPEGKPGVTIFTLHKGECDPFKLGPFKPMWDIDMVIIHDIQFTVTRIDETTCIVTSPFPELRVNGGAITALHEFARECAKRFEQFHRLTHRTITSNYAKSRYARYAKYFAYRHELEAQTVTVGKMHHELLKDLHSVLPHLSVRAYGYGAEGEKQYNKYLKIMRQLNELDIKEMQHGAQRAS